MQDLAQFTNWAKHCIFYVARSRLERNKEKRFSQETFMLNCSYRTFTSVKARQFSNIVGKVQFRIVHLNASFELIKIISDTTFIWLLSTKTIEHDRIDYRKMIETMYFQTSKKLQTQLAQPYPRQLACFQIAYCEV